jgi:ketosteroid isomerase-like protein
MVRHLERWGFAFALTALVSSVSCSDNSSGGTDSETATQETTGGAEAASNTGSTDSLSSEDEDAIVALIEDARENLAAGKYLPFAKRFMNNAKLFPPQAAVVDGKAAIADFARKSPKITSLSVTDVVVDGAGKNAIVTGNVAMLGKTNSKAPADNNALIKDVAVNCSLLVTLKKSSSGEWRAKNVSCPSVSP